jgi:hypothetical protein
MTHFNYSARAPPYQAASGAPRMPCTSMAGTAAGGKQRTMSA